VSPGVILFVNFLSIPFINEAEKIGCINRRFPKFLELMQLRITRKERWFKFYLIFLAIWLLLIFIPPKSGRKYEATIEMILTFFVLQVVLWIYVIYKIKSSKRT
jgi:hypothetical protein